MKLKKIRSILLSGCLALTAAAIAFSAVTLSWFTAPGDSTEKALNGEVGLRGYFFAGDGATESTAYEIVSPIHLLNLSRLQSIGIFPKKTYFRLGHIFDANRGPQFINIVDGVPTYSSTLDMSGVTIRPIGNEATPFYGTFDGRGLTIANLVVEGTPEDIGLFGYVGVRGAIKYVSATTGQIIREPAVTGEIKNLICENITVRSVGRVDDGSDLADMFSQLTYGEEVHNTPQDEEAFITSGALAGNTTLDFYEYNTTSGNYVRHNMTGWNDESPNVGQFSNINAYNETDSLSMLALDGDLKIHKGYLLPHFPKDLYPGFDFYWQSSNELITTSDVLGIDLDTTDDDNSADELIVFDLTKLMNSTKFNAADGNFRVESRFYLVASLKIGEYTYSKVIQSYTIAFVSNFSTAAQGNYKLYIYCDYARNNKTGDINTGYHHGNNIGFIAGHVDGTVKDCFVFGGRFDINYNAQAPYTSNAPIFTESSTGLIGEINANVTSEIDPEIQLSPNGTIGVLNLTGIYDLIRRDAAINDTTWAGNSGDKYYMAIDTYLKETSSRFSEYLRQNDFTNGTYYIIKTDSISTTSDWQEYNITSTSDSFNKVDFKNNIVIEDDFENNINRELGVFKIVSEYSNRGNSYPLQDNLDSCVIKKGKSYNKVYFSTAEFDHQNTEFNEIALGDWDPFRATTTPSYSSLSSFDYPFSREYNYVFQLDLTQKNILGTNYYMWNTKNVFLQNYLQSKLINEKGDPLTPLDPLFGFSFRTSGNQLTDEFSSYIPIGKPGAKHQYGTFTEDSKFGEYSKGDPRYLPSNCIVFDIDNDRGANISVVGKDANITVYSYDPVSPNGGVTPLYTMKSTGKNETDSNRYFEYNGDGGTTDTEVRPLNGDMKGDNDVLYGHIFKLDGGEGKHYAIGCESGKASVYYLSIQGQTRGTLGTSTRINIGDSMITNVEFVVDNPIYSNTFPSNMESYIAKLSFESKFNNEYHNKNFIVDIIDDVVGDPGAHLNIEYTNSPKFITYLLSYVRPDYIPYYINRVLGVPKSDGSQVHVSS